LHTAALQLFKMYGLRSQLLGRNASPLPSTWQARTSIQVSKTDA